MNSIYLWNNIIWSNLSEIKEEEGAGVWFAQIWFPSVGQIYSLSIQNLFTKFPKGPKQHIFTVWFSTLIGEQAMESEHCLSHRKHKHPATLSSPFKDRYHPSLSLRSFHTFTPIPFTASTQFLKHPTTQKTFFTVTYIRIKHTGQLN